MIQEILCTQPRAHWLALLDTASVPCAPLQTLDEVVVHPQTEALGMLRPTPDGRMRLMGLPISFDGTRPAIRRDPAPLGADTAMVLQR
jgi:crotonobetainyl-CoA:carnitine CoA-transferase CaiB-like acyl-CoA transferase